MKRRREGKVGCEKSRYQSVFIVDIIITRYGTYDHTKAKSCWKEEMKVVNVLIGTVTPVRPETIQEMRI